MNGIVEEKKLQRSEGRNSFHQKNIREAVMTATINILATINIIP